MNVKKLLKKQKSAVMPSDSVKRRIAADCGVAEEAVIPVGGGAAVKSRGNKIIAACAGLCAVAAATACAIIFLNPSAPSITPDVINFGSVSSATEFYAYSAVSIGTMLDSTDLTSVASAFALADTYDTTSTISTEITDLQKKTLDKYAVFATGMLGGGKITSSCTAADKEGYEFKLGIGYTDGFGSSAETVLYFNKVADSIKVDGDEEEFAIEGELVKGNVSFPIEGKYEIETDGDETENEIWFKVNTSENSYIIMEYEHSSETDETESELVVSVYENDDWTEKAKIKGETGEDTSFKVLIERHDGGEDVEIEFTPYEEDGEKIMQVDAWFGEDKHELIMRNRPWEQGGGFDFVNRGNGNGQGGFEDDKDDWEDEDKKDKDDKEDKEEPNPVAPPEFPDEKPDEFPDEKPDFDWDGENPVNPLFK